MDYRNFDANQLQEMSCDYIGRQEWVQDILSKMLDAAQTKGAMSGVIYEKDHPELKDATKKKQLTFFLRQRGLTVEESPLRDGGNYLVVDWNFTPTARKFYDLWDANDDFMTAVMEAMEGSVNLADIIGAGIVAWMNGRGSTASERAESYIRNHIETSL